MMVLMFKVGDDRFGLNVTNIVEVIPCVPLQKLPKSPPYISGLLNYRGSVVPVVDLSHLIGDRQVRACLSSRIILIKTSSNARVGLLAEGVTETVRINDADFTNTKIDSEFGWLVDKVVIDEDGMIQHINPEVIVPDELSSILEDNRSKASEEAADAD